METIDKLKILSESSQYDLACACGTNDADRRKKGEDGKWIYPVTLPNGGHSILLKTLMSNACTSDCSYCPLRNNSNIRRCTLSPEEKLFPFMMELFSRVPDFLLFDTGREITPISFEDEASSLSAILIENDYYEFIKEGIRIIAGLPILLPEYLIPLKAKAYLDLSEKKLHGKNIESKDITKHQNDIFRLYPALSPETKVNLSPLIADDINNFLTAMTNQSINLKQLGISTTKLEQVLAQLKDIYLKT